MSMTDPVADFLTHIRNAAMRGHPSVESPSSKLKLEIARVLKEEGYIVDYSAAANAQDKMRLTVELKYDEEGDCIIRGLKRISRPGLRTHTGFRDLSPVLNGQGIAIVTTSQGVLTDYECRKRQVGGEVLCQVW